MRKPNRLKSGKSKIQRTRNRRYERRCGFEQLEDRRVLTGCVEPALGATGSEIDLYVDCVNAGTTAALAGTPAEAPWNAYLATARGTANGF